MPGTQALRKARLGPLQGGPLPGPLSTRSPSSGGSGRHAARPTKAPRNDLHTLTGRKTVRPVPAGSRDDT
ncbi:hypothetical protein ADK65_35760 [Streptomyces sp. NRRL B-1140]|nr:hypothetical protein ADK65_35760 [Streptomyces sp. NRRL B-1140]